jgi:hypothetical protein
MTPSCKSEFRPLSAAELDDVSGGVAFLAGMFTGACVVNFGDLPPGKTKEDAARALGVPHLL